MSNFRRLLTFPLSSSTFDRRIGQWICWSISILILMLGFYKLSCLPVNEKELFFGILLVIAVSLLGVLIGLVLPLAADAASDH